MNGRKRSFVNSKKKSGKQDSLSAAVIRYTDGCETLLSEGELLVILQRRRTDPFWKRVAFIRNYIPSWQEPGESIKVDFNICNDDSIKKSHSILPCGKEQAV